MPRITVIGAGFLGNALAVGAAKRGWRATVIGRSDPYDTATAAPGAIRFIAGDAVERFPATIDDDGGGGVHSVVIAAGGLFPLPSARAPAADAVGTLSLVVPLCETVRSLSPDTRIVFLSSAGAVYSPGEARRRESDAAEPTSPYGMSRLVGEEYLGYYRRVHGLCTHALRVVNVYGRLLPASRGQGVVSAAFRSALTGTPFTVHGDGGQTRDFLHVDDFVAATLDLLGAECEIPATVNVGTGVGSTIADVLHAVCAATGATIATTPGPSANTDTGNLTVDPSLLQSLIEFEPLDLETGIARMARAVRAQGATPSVTPPDAVVAAPQQIAL